MPMFEEGPCGPTPRKKRSKCMTRMPSNMQNVRSNLIVGQIPLESQVVNANYEPKRLPHSSGISVCSKGSAEKKVVISCQAENICTELQFEMEHAILFLYEHVKNCPGEGNMCSYPFCNKMKSYFPHMRHCRDIQCKMHCIKYKQLLSHFEKCQTNSCPLCMPVRIRLKGTSQGTISSPESVLKSSFTDAEPPLKRKKMENPCPSGKIEGGEVSPLTVISQKEHNILENLKPNDAQPISRPVTASMLVTATEEFHDNCVEKTKVSKPRDMTVEPAQVVHPEIQDLDVTENANDKPTHTKATSDKREKEEVKLTALLGTSSRKQLSPHIPSLQDDMVEEKTKSGRCQATENSKDQYICNLCGMGILLLEPPPRHCESCDKLIKPKGVYYFLESINSREYGYDGKIYFCSKCRGPSGGRIKVGSKRICKLKLERGINYAETEAKNESWVQCDNCEAWQHEICALFNTEQNKVINVEYICQKFQLQDFESRKCEPSAQTRVLVAKDLPTTLLSDYIEQWLFRRLEQEREERASNLKQRIDEVPGATGLTIRVVSSVDKKLKVNPLFCRIFEEEEYPAEFPYRSKVILMFQNFEGVDVCLFAMYVQEYGSDCPSPNQRRVCISYIDSVKYFRPEIKAVTGEALRTFVYHEILIGYLDFCKQRGFTSCYIWSCPSVKQDHYILYCHPRMQKSPRPDKLQDWYQAMIQKGMKEKIIVEHTNLYDNFFVQASECKAKVTAARLPYFDGDAWPASAEILLKKDEEDESQREGTKAVNERALRAAKRDASSGKPKDILLMHQLGEIIRESKENFILIHLQHECNHCHQPILTGKKWICRSCKKEFRLCEQCYGNEQKLDMKDRHPIANSEKDKHSFQLDKMCAQTDTVDEDVCHAEQIF